MRYLACAISLLATATCATVEGAKCGGYENGKLAGMYAGAKLTPPDPETAHGKRVIADIRYLETVCQVPNRPL